MSEPTLGTKVTEEELIKRAVAERVTLEQVNGSIVGEYYFTGSEAVKNLGINIPEDLDRVTICMLRLYNGFIILGHSAPASAANFDANIGKRLARERAIMQIWTLLGFELKTRQWIQESGENLIRGGKNSEPEEKSSTSPVAQPQESEMKEPFSSGSEPEKNTTI